MKKKEELSHGAISTYTDYCERRNYLYDLYIQAVEDGRLDDADDLRLEISCLDSESRDLLLAMED
jgi:hypothetical protein